MKTEALDASGLDWLGGLTRALLAVAALLGGVWLYARIKSPFAYFGTTYDSRPLAAGFSATDQSGQPFEFASTRGEVVALFFGFTRCPDICPLTLNYLRKAKEQLPADVQDDLRIVFVSLDPERDTVAQLQAYTNFFGGGLTGLRLPEPQLAAVAKSYGVGYAKAPIQPKGASASSGTGTSGNYAINHTTATYLIDREGKMRLVWDYTQLPQLDRVVRDLRQVLKE
ncbi:SCO family protein [Deinococcus peraridilitoris]|uniref:Uncharacterized protein SCO1/SenC/PrrC, involved in biogenesis of respiratory and photosynthetic systems n=1 Tax=Deinococcus peraridilitoris (strain DSM 19664 / LMG 22246 / CIP 109416 / KR-200) TaxID=937777 RepID=U3GK28_DEIPD|nr:SCO family protein [Deinococcus peraridilitoris]AFZ67982.1 uncharacterized protein SCO1/SenC/PrrC, involved in biogenesis of respiratory and photosynthetic systems [Deinococcus peraridilitoris DSM 19664]